MIQPAAGRINTTVESNKCSSSNDSMQPSTCSEPEFSVVAVRPMRAACMRIRSLRPAFHEPPAAHSLHFSLSASGDFSNVALLPARLTCFIILALKANSIHSSQNRLKFGLPETRTVNIFKFQL